MTYKTTMKKKLGALALTLVFMSPAWAQETTEGNAEEPRLGLSTDFGDVLIENLGIGRSYNLRELAGAPLKVKNNSTELVNLLIEPTIPKEDMITGKRKNFNVKPIPSLTWITIGQNEFLLPPGETAFSDVIINIPDDPSLYGKRFQASIHSKTTGENFLQLGVWSHLVFYITDSPEKQKKQEEARSKGIRQTAEFSLLPDKVFYSNVPVGKKVTPKKLGGRSIKVANIGGTPVELKLTLVNIKDTPLSLQSGFESGAAAWIEPKKDVITLEPDSIWDPEWTIKIPKGDEHKNKNYMFVVRVEPTDPDLVSFTFYGRFYIETEKE